MAEGLISAAADTLLDELTTTYTYVQLHVGAPGAAGTSNPAEEDSRVQVTWGSPSGGTVSNSADVVWEGVAAAEDFTHFSVWSAASSGSCGFTGTITANAVQDGDNFVIPAGQLTASFTVAS